MQQDQKMVSAAVGGDVESETIRDWQATLLRSRDVLESHVALKQQALQNPWVQACLKSDLRLQDLHLGSFIQACMQ